MSRDALTIAPEPGECFGCGCTEFAPCLDEQIMQPCAWANEARTFCTVCALAWARGFMETAAMLHAQAAREAVLLDVQSLEGALR